MKAMTSSKMMRKGQTMNEYKPRCDVCPHYNSCAVQKTLKTLYEERFNRSRELAGRTDGFVNGKYFKDVLKGTEDE